ncbi:hypothetical protein SAY86_024892 [Trapa natans]|uniref:Uncharacterized protein n=1 Tax=Trapa natans TaxID=22666 RepID=A0AAN7M7E3_TRANT|nr:hypothetical protein SAY86_024892 [Trapa natans]
MERDHRRPRLHLLRFLPDAVLPAIREISLLVGAIRGRRGIATVLNPIPVAD